MPLTMVSARNATATHPAFAIFRTPPRMTKHEIKEYLTKIYNLPVKKVATANYLGKRKRVMTSKRIHFLKYKDFKKAVVTFDDSLQDVGLGMRVPELDDDEGDGGFDLDDAAEEDVDTAQEAISGQADNRKR